MNVQIVNKYLKTKIYDYLSAQEFNPRNELERVLNSNQNINNSYVFKLLEHLISDGFSNSDISDRRRKKVKHRK